MDLHEGIDFARGRREGVLVTRRADGRPQLSNIFYDLGGEEGGDEGGDGSRPVVRISLTDSRAKTRNLRREPSASLYVPGESFWSYLVLDGMVELSPVASAPDDAIVEELIGLYRSIRGEDHPNWAEYRDVMVTEGRLIARLYPDHAYGVTQR